MRHIIDQSGGRRFIMAVGAGVATTALQWFGKLDPGGTTYGMVVAAIVWGYVAGNTAQKIKGVPDVGTSKAP